MPIPQLQIPAKMLRMSRRRYLYGLSTIPEERLTWSPGGDAKTPLELVRGAADFLQFTAHFVTHQSLPSREFPAPWHGGGTITLEFFLVSTIYVDGYLQGQLNYLQTAYGDTNPNIPEGWGNE